jgi:hypothetical protein
VRGEGGLVHPFWRNQVDRGSRVRGPVKRAAIVTDPQGRVDLYVVPSGSSITGDP